MKTLEEITAQEQQAWEKLETMRREHAALQKPLEDAWRESYSELRKATARAEVLAEMKATWKGQEKLPDGPDTAALPRA